MWGAGRLSPPETSAARRARLWKRRRGTNPSVRRDTMKTLILGLAATTALTVAAGAAPPQPGLPTAPGEAQVEARSAGGIRSGDLPRREAADLRAQFNAIAN